MKNNELIDDKKQEKVASELEEVIREGARRLLQAAIEQEMAKYIAALSTTTDEKGKRMIVRNGHLSERSILTGIGPISVKQPRVKDKREEKESFVSGILPRYLHRVPSMDNLIPTLHVKGISTGDFMEALGVILGENTKGLSANTYVRLKRQWETEYKEWAHRDLTHKRYVYFLS